MLCRFYSAFCRTWLRWWWLARVNNTQTYTTCPLFQTKRTHLKFRLTLNYGTSASDILLRRVYNLHLPCYLLVKISFSFIIIVVFVSKKTTFSLSTIKSHSPFNLLHCDILGSHKTPTHFEKRFFFSHYSRWLY